MRKSVMVITMAMVFGIVFSAAAFAQSHDHGKAGQMEMDHSGQAGTAMDHSGHMGELIHESSVDGYTFAYHLIDMKEKMKDMKNMPEMKATHHLMLYVSGPDGKAIEEAKVGYMIEGPGDAKQKLMCMGMSGGFGADVDLGAKGVYTVKSKVAAGEKNLMDTFTYEVK
jgi:hypothetical protein